MVREHRETFHIVGQSKNGAVPTSGAYAVVDTSVLSIIEGMARNGYSPRNVQHRRAAHLMRWLLKYDVDLVNTAFATIEGVGYHAGGVSFHNVLHRSIPIEHLRRLNEQELDDFLRSGEGLALYMPTEALEQHIGKMLEDAAGLHQMLFGPAYLVTLALRSCLERNGCVGKKALDRVAELLGGELNFVPAIPWLTTVLAAYGTQRVARELRQEVLKLQHPDIRRSSMSGAWDLAYLGLVSHFRMENSRYADLQVCSDPVVVTDDDALAKLATYMRFDGQNVEIVETLIDPARSEDCYRVCCDMADARRRALPALPERDQLVRLINDLEDELNISRSTLMVLPPKVSPAPQKSAMIALLRCLRFSGKELLLELVSARGEGDLLFAGLQMLGPLVDDNCRVRDRSRDQALTDLASAVRGTAGPDVQDASPMVGEMMVSAWHHQQSITANALLERVEAVQTGLYDPALIYVARFLQELLSDTAAARNEPLGDVLDRLLRRVEVISDGPALSERDTGPAAT